MAMTGFEKQFVNRRQKAERNITNVSTRLEQLDISNINDVLEIGSGVGFVSAWLVETYGVNVYGTDFDPDQVITAQELHPESEHLHFGVEDASDLSFTDSSFDLVLSQNVFHHIPDWKRAVREVRRVLRPEGYFIWYDLVFPKFVQGLFQPFVSNYGLYTFDDIQSEFVNNGFIELFHERVAHGPFTHHHYVLQKD
ncbi:MAG TPA: class I SAM-dependent methyltransferase [Anaerolineales bacterium]|nr:class I SAM-dependent methyltransferase [Anaerolineales bacterium]